jgi:hypothetical protein
MVQFYHSLHKKFNNVLKLNLNQSTLYDPLVILRLIFGFFLQLFSKGSESRREDTIDCARPKSHLNFVFTSCNIPTVTSVTPMNGKAGQNITITGKTFPATF